MSEWYMSQDLVREFFHYDNGDLLWKKRTSNRISVGDVAGTIDKSNGYKKISLLGKREYAHRIVWVWHNGNIPNDLEIDHINRIREDNRISNLRLATRSLQVENSSPQKVRVDSRSGMSNISWRGSRNSWSVVVQENGKQKYIGGAKDLKKAKEILRKYKEDINV